MLANQMGALAASARWALRWGKLAEFCALVRHIPQHTTVDGARTGILPLAQTLLATRSVRATNI